MGSIETNMILNILPEIVLLVLGTLILAVDLLWSEEQRKSLGWFTAGGLVLAMVAGLIFSRPGEQPELIWGGMIRLDWLAFTFKMVAIFGAAITSLFAMNYKGIARKGEFYILLVVSTMGMGLMAGAANLIMLFLAIETASIPLYVMAGFMKADKKSIEAGFKYLLFGATASAMMAYGFSLLYGFTGTADIYKLAGSLRGGLDDMAMIMALLFVIVGFGFKVSAVPFHFWAPDVYEGAPTPVAGFLSTASKAAGFAVLIRFLVAVFPAIGVQWVALAASLSAITMIVGNTIALAQTNIKRLLAYSSIAHAGYILIGVAAATGLGMASAVFYLVAYLMTNLAAFGVVAVVSRTIGSDEISAYAGLSRRSQGLSLAMMVAMLSLAGMPPLAGFVTKVFVFAAAVQSDMIWLAILGVLNAIVGLYYYLIVLKVVYLYRSDNDDQPVPVTRPDALALGILTFAIILVGTLFGPWWGFAEMAAAAIF